MAWSLVKEYALRDLVRRGIAYDKALMALSDVRDDLVPATVSRLLVPPAEEEVVPDSLND